MRVAALERYDFSKWQEPDPHLEPRELLETWLDYQRHEFVRKLRDLTPAQMAAWSVPPLNLSVLGLVRHMTQMEHVYLGWGLGGGTRHLIYGDDDYAGGSAESASEDIARYFEAVELSGQAIAGRPDLDSAGLGHGRPLGATMIKMVDEYAIHAGQAHMLRFASLGELIR